MRTNRFPLLLAISGLLLASCGGDQRSQTNSGQDNGAEQVSKEMVFKLEKVADDLTAPMLYTHAGDGSGRQFIVEQPGRILVFKDGKVSNEPFLDLTSVVVPLNEGYSEMGLLGLAFHPDYKTNGRFFVYYSTGTNQKGADHKSVLAEYKVSAGNPDRAEQNEKRLMEIQEPESNHNGGCLAFGPDGMLYVSLGDGGGAGDQHGTIGNAQNPEQLLGSIIRLDVNKPSGNTPFSIPADNPFVDKPGRDEIYANGLRNPWRFSFDRKTGTLFCADVGQDKYEEVNIIEKGKNYGWRPMEGLHVYDEKLKNQLKGDFTPPINEYDRSLGMSITGGFVYRGKQFPALDGKYFFGDWTGRLFYLEQNGNEWQRKELTFADNNEGKIDLRVNSFGEDENGEIYVVGQRKVGATSHTGEIYRLTLANAPGQSVGMK